MRLRHKISLLCVAILLAAMLLFGISSLLQAKKSIEQLTEENIRARNSGLAVSFSSGMRYYEADAGDALTAQALAKYLFARHAEITDVLVMDGEVVYSNIAIVPQEMLLLPADGGQQALWTEWEGNPLLLVGSALEIGTHRYAIYLVEDVSGVYASIRAMVWQLVCTGAITLVLCVGAVVLCVRRATAGMEKLSRATRRMAGGNYAERADVASADEIGALAKDFNDMAAAVQAHMRALEDTAQRQQLFMGSVAHEYKTPLTSMIGLTETLLFTKQPAAVQLDALERMHAQCLWLERLTQKLLGLITLDAGMQPREVAVASLLEEVSQSMREVFDARGVLLQTAMKNELLWMDADLMRAALCNLCENACKASGAGQTVTMRYEKGIFSVSDQGCGIPQEHLRLVTDPFYMVDASRAKQQGGVGLGLTLVRRIAQAHGARFSITSSVGVGTTASISFPAAGDDKFLTSP